MKKRGTEIEALNMTLELSSITGILGDLQRKWGSSTARKVLINEGEESTVEGIDMLFSDLREQFLLLQRE
jgi:cytochrome b